MKVLQLIDSLNPGGAEKMALNIANALLPHVEGSYLCCTRQEGMLKDQLQPEVGYIFLNKRSSIDLKATLKLNKYIKDNKIGVVHAHSTSFFLAGLLKLMGTKIKLVWHDHYGESEFLEKRNFKILKIFSVLFNGIISVNTKLKTWALKNLKCKNVIELKNFIPSIDESIILKSKLKGNPNDFKIVCVANLRPQKDHLNLLNAFELLKSNKSVSLHIIGEDPGTFYSKSVLNAFKNSISSNRIHYYGTQQEILQLLKQADLGVLSSRSEGLPIALLEYGMAGLPVVCTNVGQCAEVIKEFGKIVDANDPNALAIVISYYIENEEVYKQDSLNFNNEVVNKYSEHVVLPNILKFYFSLNI